MDAVSSFNSSLVGSYQPTTAKYSRIIAEAVLCFNPSLVGSHLTIIIDKHW